MVAIPRVVMNTDMREGRCFGCGAHNAIGLKLSFRDEAGGVRTEYTPVEDFQGWPGIVHGGILGCLLDEAVGYAARFAGVKCLTAKMTMRISRPVRIGEALVITARVTRRTRKLLTSEAQLATRDGKVVAEATATQFIITEADGENAADA
ncbi:MAG: PaaI family thioesterase [Chloroflexota bacterium]